MDDDRERILGIVSRILDVPKDSIKPSSRFVEDLGLDSIDAEEIKVELEDEFGIFIDDKIFENLHTFNQLCNYTKSLVLFKLA